MPEVKVENLEAEMKRKKISRSDIASLLGLSYRTIHSRFNGESEWGYSECVKVRDTYRQLTMWMAELGCAGHEKAGQKESSGV